MFKWRLLQKKNLILIAILFLGFGLRIWGLGSAEIFHDEGIDAFRSIGYLDYLQTNDQSTPIQWFKDAPQVPFWTYLSFHDHPPLFFFLQHIFFSVFGDSIFVARLPSLIAGMVAIFLMYLIGKTLFDSEEAGLLGALLLSVNQIHIWISRSSILESVLVTLILANIYFFLKFLENKRQWKWFGLTLGLCFLTKYTSFFLIPAYIVYLLVLRRDLLRAGQIWGAAAISLALFSPVIIYNAYLYKAVHHFDLQLAYLFHQPTPEWNAQLGKVQEPFSRIIQNLLAMYSMPFLGLALVGFCIALLLAFRGKKEEKQVAAFSLLLFIFATVILMAVGSAFRFLTLLLPAMIFFILILFVEIRKRIRKNTILAIVAALFLISELYFTIDGIYLTFPDFGIVRLDQYLSVTLGSKRPFSLPQSPNPHLDAVIREYALNYPRGDRKILLVYDENISLSERLWLFTRRLYYHGTPAVTAGNFKDMLRSRGVDALKGYEIYFVKASPYTLLNPYLSVSDAGELEGFLRTELHLNPDIVVYGYQHLPMFSVYKILM